MKVIPNRAMITVTTADSKYSRATVFGGPFGFGGAGVEEAMHQAPLLAEGIEAGQSALDQPLPARLGIAVETPVHTARDDKAAGKRLAKLGR